MPIERIITKCRFGVEARERFWIKKYDVIKKLPVEDIESGLNLK